MRRGEKRKRDERVLRQHSTLKRKKVYQWGAYLVESLRVLGQIVCIKRARRQSQRGSPELQVPPAFREQLSAPRTPEHVVVLQVRLRVTLLSVDEPRKFGWVTQEEHGGVVLLGGAAAKVSLRSQGT